MDREVAVGGAIKEQWQRGSLPFGWKGTGHYAFTAPSSVAPLVDDRLEVLAPSPGALSSAGV